MSAENSDHDQVKCRSSNAGWNDNLSASHASLLPGHSDLANRTATLQHKTHKALHRAGLSVACCFQALAVLQRRHHLASTQLLLLQNRKQMNVADEDLISSSLPGTVVDNGVAVHLQPVGGMSSTSDEAAAAAAMMAASESAALKLIDALSSFLSHLTSHPLPGTLSRMEVPIAQQASKGDSRILLDSCISAEAAGIRLRTKVLEVSDSSYLSSKLMINMTT
jgi:hypothetical protein